MERTLLLVDDEENIMDALVRLLRRDDYKILKGNSGKDALALLAQHEVGVIIADQRMPEMTGVEFLSQVKELYPDTVRIVLSGYADINMVTDAINRGAIYKFLTKPWNDEQLSSSVLEAFVVYELLQEKKRLSLDIQGAHDQMAHINRELEELVGRKDSQIERISEFISTVSHELRTPLTSIRGSLGLLAGGVAGALPETAKNLVDIAKNNCERLILLVNDILDVEKIGSGKMRLDLQVIDIRPVVQQALAANESFAAQHRVSVLLRMPDEPLQVHIDSDRLTQVLTNLLSNAVKFSPPEAAVEVRVSRVGQQVRVEVADHGPGIPEEFRSRIFQKFSQADSSDTRQKGGTGLGLNISKSLVELMNGAIGFNNQLGAGTTFFFELPEWKI